MIKVYKVYVFCILTKVNQDTLYLIYVIYLSFILFSLLYDTLFVLRKRTSLLSTRPNPGNIHCIFWHYINNPKTIHYIIQEDSLLCFAQLFLIHWQLVCELCLLFLYMLSQSLFVIQSSDCPYDSSIERKFVKQVTNS